jgi:hypothetical protein
MLTELKRCNSIGNTDGVLFLISIIAGKERIARDEIRNRCALENNITVNCPGAVAFLEYLGLVSATEELVSPMPELNKIAESDREGAINQLVTMTIEKLTEDGIFDCGGTGFDAEKGKITISRSAFPLEYAAVRNFLIMEGVLDKEAANEICINGDYESDWTEQIGKRRKKLTLEQLLKRQEEQSNRGLEAEEYVLSLERARLPGECKRIKRISDFDVSAGYDIVSFESAGAEHYDRFIEVKCFIGEPHFYWSENEMDVAKIKTDKYILCIVDYTKIGDPGYVPTYIRDPYGTITHGDEWLIVPSSYRVQKI